MGLIKSALSAVSSTLADQYKEYFYCEALNNDVLVVKGQKQSTGGLFSGNHGSDNIISNGSGIVVADGQCMVIVDDGKIVEVAAEPGVFTFDTSSEPSIFSGSLGESLKASWEVLGKRISYGGETGHDQRVYYFNTKPIINNKFGTPNPVPFRVVDSRINLDVDVQIRCAGTYSFQIFDPVLFYTNVCGNVSDAYYVNELSETMRNELVSALQPALAKLSELQLRPSEIIAHNLEIEDGLNEALTHRWQEERGIIVRNVALATVSLTEEAQKMITDAQRAAMYTNQNMVNAGLVDAHIQATKDAANNPAGAFAGFYGMNMANQMSGLQYVNSNQAPAAETWTCPQCGNTVAGNFCNVCGTRKPE